MVYGPIVLIAVVGRLLVWALQTSGPTKRIWKLHPILKELGECDFCLGAWVFTGLAWAAKVNLLEPLYIGGIAEVATGCSLAFVMHILRIGWQTRFGTLELSSDS